MSLFGYAGAQCARDGLGALPGYTASMGAGSDPGNSTDCVAPLLCDIDDIVVAIQGRPSLSPPEIFRAYRNEGPGFLQSLTGSFALAIIDRPARSLLLAIDRMGIESLAYRATDQGIIFSTSIRAIAECPGHPARLRHQALFDFLLLHMVPAPDTVFENISKLRAATYVRFAGGRIEMKRYWVPSFTDEAQEPESKLRIELLDCLRQAVTRCQPGKHTGAFLSGGLDSSTVAGLLGEVTRVPARTFSIGFGVDSYDELAYAEIANQHFHAIGTQYQVTAEDVITAIPLIAQAFDEPFGNSSSVPTYFCAKLAADHGITELLAGDGGDELFAGNERYGRQQVFERYQMIPAVLRRMIIEPLARRVSPDAQIAPLRKLRSYVDQAGIPLPERLESWNFMYRADPDAMLEPEFRLSVDPRSPFRGMTELYESAPSDRLQDRMLFYDWQMTLADNDLRKVGVMCAMAGVGVSYPMLDQAVVELSLRVPAQLKMQGLTLRTFYKKAMQGFLPPEIIAKGKHGFGLPFGVWLKSHRRLGDLVHSLLSDLKRRRIVRARFLDDLIQNHVAGHASYYGYAIWDLAILEAWLQAHGQKP